MAKHKKAADGGFFLVSVNITVYFVQLE